MNLTVSRYTVRLLVAIILAASPLDSQDKMTGIPAANPLRGNLALAQKGCITCHSIWGVGGKLGPDLATAGADQSFQQIASMFWNHTPRMVQLLKQKGIEWPALSEQEMADITSFIYYLKLLDRPGDAALGKIIFREKKCHACHSLQDQPRGALLSLARYGSYVSPVALAQAMWNSGQEMRQNQQTHGIAMPLFAGREMADLQSYIRSEAASPSSGTVYLPLPDINRGGGLFRSKGCSGCHTVSDLSRGLAPDLSKRPLQKSISEICGILWNHSFAMQSTMSARGIKFAKLQGNDLADILAYIYFLHFSRDQGDAARGEKVFSNKGCAICHSGSQSKGKQGPSLTLGGENYTMLRLAASMWNHAPIMYETMQSEIMKWIKLDPDDMQDLSKFLRRPPTGK